MKRFFDLVLAVPAALILLPGMVLIAVAIKMTSRGPVLYWSDRVGVGNAVFRMPKFRTMRVDTPAVATHLLDDPASFLTPVGGFLRRTSLDELPQLFSILKGDMTLVGPRPALFNQDDLVGLRTEKGVHRLIPGLTGWAQVNGRDELPVPVKVEFDEWYLNNMSVFLDFRILVMTFFRVFSGTGVRH